MGSKAVSSPTAPHPGDLATSKGPAESALPVEAKGKKAKKPKKDVLYQLTARQD
jgi:hypothetical protein